MSVLTSVPSAASTVDGPLAGAAGRRQRSFSSVLLLLPALALLLIAFVAPLFLMGSKSLSEGIGTYADVLTSPSIMKVFGNTIRIAVLTTVITLFLGYPYAYAITRSGPKLRIVLTAFVLMPYWVSVLTRTFAWVGLLQDTGVVNKFLLSIGFISEPLALIRTPWGVLIGMVQVLLPYMVISLLTTMSTIDSSLLKAAYSLGASPWQRFSRVYLPLSRGGIISGVTLVFVLALGFYITPSMLGAPSDMMVAELLVQETQKIGTVRASAIGMFLLIGMVVCFLFLRVLQTMPAKLKRDTP